MNLDDLEAKAKAATPGPWELDEYHQIRAMPASDSIRAKTPVVCPAGKYESDPVLLDNDAAYIAAASPDVLLKLIAALKESLEVGAELHRLALDSSRYEFADILGNRLAKLRDELT